MELTIPTPVTDASLEFASLVFASNFSPTPPAVVTVSTQQVQNKYWIIPLQKMELTITTPVTDDARSEFSSLVFASNLSPTPPAVVTVSTQQIQNKYWIRTPPAVIVTAGPESVQYWIRPVKETTRPFLMEQSDWSIASRHGRSIIF